MLEILTMFLLLFSAWTLGRLIPWLFNYRTLETDLFRIVIGLGLLGTLLVLIGFMNLLYFPLVFLLLMAPMAVWVKTRSAGGPGSEYKKAAREYFGEGLSRGTLLLLVTSVSALFLVHLVEALHWDYCPDRYHVIHARYYLNTHTSWPFPGVLTSLYPSLFEMLFVPGLYFTPECFGSVLHWSVAGLLALMVFAAARRYVGPFGAWTATLLYLGTPVIGIVGVFAYNDLYAALNMFAATSVLIVGIQERKVAPSIVMCGLFSGFAFASKWTAVLLLGPTTVLLVFVLWVAHRGQRRQYLKASLFALGIALLVLSPWLIRAFILTGNPLYPYPRSWTSSLTESYRIAASGFFAEFGTTIQDRLDGFGFYLVWVYEMLGVEGCGLVLLLPFFPIAYVLVLRKRPSLWIYFLYCLAAYFLFLFGPEYRVRRFSPSLAWFAVPTGVLLGKMTSKTGRRTRVWQFMMALSLCFVTAMLYWIFIISYRGHAISIPPITQTQRREQQRRLDSSYAYWDYLNGHLTEDDLVLIHGPTFRFRNLNVPFAPPPYYAPVVDDLVWSQTEGLPLTERHEALLNGLRQYGITHLLLSDELCELYGFSMPVMRWPEVQLHEMTAE